MLTRTSERSALSGESVSWDQEAIFLSILAVEPPIVHPRTVANDRGAVSDLMITEVVVLKSMLSVPSRIEI